MTKTSRSMLALLAAGAFMGLLALQAQAQTTVVNPPTAGAGGVYIDAEGVVRQRQVDATAELTQVRQRIKAAGAVKDAKLCYVSLPKLMAEVKALVDAGKPVPDELRYLGGMTQLRYVFVYAEDRDLVIAGPAEPIDATNAIQPVGKRTGRPVLQLDDLVVSLRLITDRMRPPFGCSIDPSPDSLSKSKEVMTKFASSPRNVVMEELYKAMGPQKVSVFGVQPDSRMAYICVAADYKLKRLSLGIDSSPVPGVGHAVDNSRQASNRFWFEPLYEPVLVTAQKDGYEIRGKRLQLKAGAQSFDPRGATEKAVGFAKQFTQKTPDLCTAIPMFADLQNIGDMALLANLIRQDKLDARAGWDLSWVMDAKGYQPQQLATPKTADTVVWFTSGSIVAGGVTMQMHSWAAEAARQVDDKGSLSPLRDQWTKIKGDKGQAIVMAP